MQSKDASAFEVPDPAAIFACALSLREACHKRADEEKINLSECYNGGDQFMREVMRVATLFETWASEHILFEQINDVWPYLLEDKFGEHCVTLLSASALAHFDESDCLRAALQMRLPVRIGCDLPVPLDLTAPNPIAENYFRQFRIQTVRDLLDGGDVQPFVADDEPYDGEFSKPYFSLYGISADGKLEHIADRQSYSEISSLARKLVPGIAIPDVAVFSF